ncbi:MAG: hypothetical protein FJZ97_02660 [Chloroflexi bacterium]|nr:hypothetical protein [Chloroflexota bacterium]
MADCAHESWPFTCQPEVGAQDQPPSAGAVTFHYNRPMRWQRWLQPLLLIPLLALALRLIPGPRVIDDAYISFRYARNILAGLGPFYNPGEPVLGTTTPLFVMVLTALGLVTGGANASFPHLALGVSAVADALTCGLLVALGRQFGKSRAGVAAAVFWAIAPWSVTFAVGGMETSLFIALTSASFYFHSTRRPIGTSLCGVMALLTRPDALLFLLPLALERLRQAARARNRHDVDQRIKPAELLVVIGPLIAWGALSVALYGSPVPHSIAAKAVAYHLPREASLVRLAQHLATPFQESQILGSWWIAVGLVLYPSLYLLGWIPVVRQKPWVWPLAAFPWVYVIAYAVANPLLFRWYLSPPLPLYFLGIALGIDRLASDLRRRELFWGCCLLAVAAASAAWTLRPDHGSSRPAPQMAYIRLELLYHQAAERLRGELTPGATIAAGDVGALGFDTQADILDTVGLVSPESSPYYPLPTSSYVINYAIPSQLIVDRNPDFVVLLEVYGRNTLLRDDTFLSRYGLIETYPTDIYGSRGMLIFKRGCCSE